MAKFERTVVGDFNQILKGGLLNNYMNRIQVLKLFVVVLGVIFIGTGCSNKNPIVEEITTSTTTEISAEVTTEATSEVTSEVETEVGANSSLSESEMAALEAELDALSELILSQTDKAAIQNVLDQYVAESQRDISYLYYGEADNDFWISPEMALPADYEFTQRPPYQNAVAQGVYAPEAYIDEATGRMLYTVTKAIVVEGEVVSVIGIDVYRD